MGRSGLQWLGYGCVWCMLWCWTASADSAKQQSQQAASEVVDQVLAGAQFGMSPVDVLNKIKTRIRERYADELSAAPGLLERDAIYEHARRDFQRIKDSYTKFDGDVTGWTVSPIGAEFRHGSEEAMLFVEEETFRDYYFFIRGKLWKCYRQFEPEAFGRRPFKEIAAGLVGKLGPAKVLTEPRSKDTRSQRFMRWEAAGAQLEAIDGGAHLVFVATERATLTRLADLRRNARSRRERDNTVVSGILMSEGELEAWRERESAAASTYKMAGEQR